MRKYLFLFSFLWGVFLLYGEETPVKILQMNIWQEGTMVEGGFDAIAGEVSRLEPDIVLFSEIRNYNGVSFIPKIRKALEERGKKYYGESSGLDVGILSKYEIRNQYPVHPTDNEAAAVLKAVLQIAGRKVIVYSAHLDYTRYACYLPRGYSGVTWKKLDAPVTDAAEIEQANRESLRDEAIAGVIEDAKKEKGNILFLGGDFNEPSHLDWGEDTKHLFDHRGAVVRWDCSALLTEYGFRDSFREIYPDAVACPGFTFPADNKQVAVEKLSWAPEADERDRIDYIYFLPDKKLKLKTVSIVGPSGSIVRGKRTEERTQDEFIRPAATWPSDHKALLATFILYE